MISTNDLAVVIGVSVAILYPPIGVIWRWVSHTEKRFDELQGGINKLISDNEVDVADLGAFRKDVDRRLTRLEHVQGWN